MELLMKFGKYDRVILSNTNIEASLTNLGASCLSIKYKGREVCLGYNTPEEYLSGNSCIGAIVGRLANRLENASFTLDGVEYKTEANAGKHGLHSASSNLGSKIWTTGMINSNSVYFSVFSPDGDAGFPGELSMGVEYTIGVSCLRIDFYAVADKPTPFGPTSHMYFNLDGSPDIFSHRLMINADSYLKVDKELIPLEPAAAEGKFDFRKSRPIENIYDHAFILNKKAPAVRLEAGDMAMEINTDFPAVQIYTGEFLEAPHHPFQGVAIEPEFYPNAVNRPEFEGCILRPGEAFHRFIEYKFY